MKRTGSIKFFLDQLIKIIDSRVRYNNHDGIIKSVDETKFTCSVLVGKVTYNNVPLRVLLNSQSSFIEIPKVDTNCVIVFRDANNARPYILEVHECDKILLKIGDQTLNMSTDGFVFNGASKGIPLYEELKSSIDSLKKYCEDLKAATSNGLNSVGVSTAASGKAGKAAFDAQMALSSITISDFENKKVKA